MATEAVTPINDVEKLEEPRLEKMGRTLLAKFVRFRADRRAAEQQWVKNLRQFEGEYDPDVKIDADKSRAYPKVTRQKCLGMVARLMGLLFPEGESNWGIKSSQRPSVNRETLEWIIGQWALEAPDEQLDLDVLERQIKVYADKAADRMTTTVKDQLNDTAEYGQVDYPTLARKVIESAVKLGMGVLKGPMTVETEDTRYEVENGQVNIKTGKVYRPYFSSVRLFDYYPDMHAKDFAQMDGEFERHILSKHQLYRLAKRADFYGEKIREYVRANPEGNFEASSVDTELHGMESAHVPAEKIQKGKYEVIEYWGPVDADEFRAVDAEAPEDDEDEVKATVWILGNTVIKAARNPFPEGAEMYHKFVFEEDDVNLAGKGLPQVMRDSQMGISNATRMLLDNAHSVCGPMAEIDMARLVQESGAAKLQPFEIFYTDSSEHPNATQRAVNNISVDSRITELLAIVNHFKGVADDETFVTTIPGGDSLGSEALRTQGNMSMVMGNSSLPFRDIVRNYDNFTISVIHSLIQWNRIFNSDTYMEGDLRPIAMGSTSLIAKEVRASALDNLAQTMSEEEKPYLDMQQFAKARVKVRDLPDSLMLSDERAQANIDRQTQNADAMQSLSLALQQADLHGRLSQAEQRRADAAKKRTEAGLPAVIPQESIPEPYAGMTGDSQAQQAGTPQEPTMEVEPNAGI